MQVTNLGCEDAKLETTLADNRLLSISSAGVYIDSELIKLIPDGYIMVDVHPDQLGESWVKFLNSEHDSLEIKFDSLGVYVDNDQSD